MRRKNSKARHSYVCPLYNLPMPVTSWKALPWMLTVKRKTREVCSLFVGYICSIPSANIIPSADGPSVDGTVPSGYILPNLQTGRQQMGRPICQYFAQSADILSNLQTVRRQMGRSHLATFWPLCRHFVQSAYWTKCPGMNHPVCHRNIMLADGLSHLPTGPSGYISPNLQTGRQQMGCPICQHFAQSADISSNLHTRQNLPRWALPSADGIKCWQMGRPICRWARLQTGCVARWTYIWGLALQAPSISEAWRSMTPWQPHQIWIRSTDLCCGTCITVRNAPVSTIIYSAFPVLVRLYSNTWKSGPK